MTHKGVQKPPHYQDSDCKELEELHEAPSFDDKLDQKLGEEKVTTSTAKVSPPCSGIGNPIMGTSCSGFIRQHFKQDVNKVDCSILDNGVVIIQKTIESLGSIVLSPPQPELKSADVQFCEGYKKTMNSRQCHAEVSVLSTLAKKGCLKKGVNLLFNINWTADPLRVKAPCSQCHQLMKDIVEKCEVNIEICSQSGEAVKIRKNQDHQDLVKKVMNRQRSMP